MREAAVGGKGWLNSRVPKLRKVLVPVEKAWGGRTKASRGRPMGCRGEDEPLTSNDDRTVVLSI